MESKKVELLNSILKIRDESEQRGEIRQEQEEDVLCDGSLYCESK